MAENDGANLLALEMFTGSLCRAAHLSSATEILRPFGVFSVQFDGLISLFPPTLLGFP